MGIEINPNENCHTYCPYGKYCRYAEGCNGMDYNECTMYYKIDDLLQDARYVSRELEEADEADEYDE